MTRGTRLVFWTCFNALPLSPDRTTAEWTARRFRHWRAFTLASILGQHHPDFEYWLVCDRSLRHLTEPWTASVDDGRVRIVYTDEWPERRRQLAPADRYLFARIDSDDVYHPRVAGHLARHRTDRAFFQFNRGYACDVTSGRVFDWVSRSSPFYCRVHGEEVREYAGWDVVDHSTVRPRATVLGPGHFLVLVHERNTSTRAPARTRHGPPAAKKILGTFGIGTRRGLEALVAQGLRPLAARHRRQAAERLAPLHRRYLADVAPTSTVSLETATLFRALCEGSRAGRILDLGSGFGAVAARDFAGASVTCDSVDADPAQLQRTRCFLARAGLDGNGLSTGARPPRERSYDVVLCNLERHEVSGLRPVLRCVAPSGFLLLTGLRPDHSRAVEAHLRDHVADEFPDVDGLTAGERHPSTRLFGRVIGPLR